MLPSCHGQVLSGTQGLPLPESDPKCLLTPDPPTCPAFIDGDGLASGRATPIYATLAGRGLFEKLCEDVTSKLHRMQEHQQEQEEDDRKGLGGMTAHSSLRRAISAAGPPVKPPQSTILSQGQMPGPPAEVQSRQAALGPPLGLGEPPSAAREIVESVGSLGHPHTCNEACKYLKRKSGCLMGTSCNRCHLCHWTRKGKEPVQPVEERAPPPPAATHPRPATRPTGTAPRAATAARAPATPLSASPWLAEALRPQLAVSSMEPAYVHVSSGAAGTMALGGANATMAAGDAEAARGAATVSQFPSVGSIGHPHRCGRACKYAGKTSGCKVGHLCNRCHLCHWTRSKEHSYAADLK